jgi:hypothetical protein
VCDGLEAECSGAVVVWATVDASWGPSEFRSQGERLVTLRVLYAIPTQIRLGLHAWRATLEGVHEAGGLRVLFVAHEVEKGVRMAARQSWCSLALLGGAEVRAADGIWSDLPWQLATLVGLGSVRTLENLAAGYVAAGWSGEALRLCLAALRLAGSGLLALRVPGQFPSADNRVDASSLLERVEEARQSSSLPSGAPGYDAVSEWLVAVRLEECGAP